MRFVLWLGSVLLLIAFAVGVPAATIWALNALGVAVPYTVETFVAVWVLVLLAAAV